MLRDIEVYRQRLEEIPKLNQIIEELGRKYALLEKDSASWKSRE